MDAWTLRYERGGVWVGELGLWLDPQVGREVAFVSHAHFDHLARHERAIVSEGTGRLVRVRYPSIKELEVHRFGEPFGWGGEWRLTLLPSGHIAGSSMLLVEGRAGRLLYTGDFKLRDGRTSERCEPVRAETLIMETTYGLPQYCFPPSEEVVARLVAFCRGCLEEGEVPVVLAYSLGKSQELVRALVEAGLPVMAHRAVAEMTEVYRAMGVEFPRLAPWAPGSAGGHVVVCPPNVGGSTALKRIGKRRTAAVTGWAMAPGAVYRLGCDVAFPLSDHAGFDDLLAMVEAVKPERVWTLHGFAAEFAATLRERGVEAWALTSDNQLELGLGLGREPGRRLGREEEVGGSWGEWCEVLEACARTTRRSAKVARLARYFVERLGQVGGMEELEAGVALVAVERLGGEEDGVRLAVGPALIRRAVQAVAGVDRAEFREVYLRHGDTGETVGAVLAGRTRPESATVVEVREALRAVAATREPTRKVALLEELFRRQSGRSGKWLAKVMTGDLRAGLREGVVEEALAEAFGVKVEEVRWAHLLTGDLAETARRAAEGTLAEATLRVGRPVRFMLASPEPDEEAVMRRAGADWWVEEKLDGIRCQLHRTEDGVRLFSRDLKELTGAFPEIVTAGRGLRGEWVLDGELLAFDGQRALPFAMLQKRLGRREGDLFLREEVPLVYVVYDCLFDGRTRVGESLRARRAVLEALFAGGEVPGIFRLSAVEEARDAENLAVLFERARRRGNEGLMVKDPEEVYRPGQRGWGWIKLKRAFATIDAVVVAAEWGHGKRKGFLSDYTFAVRDEGGGLRVIGKAYSGLTDAELAEMTEVLKRETVEVIKGRLHRVEPRRVIEVAFDSIQASDRHDSGLALRFPRIKRLRPDKGPEEIETLEQCRRLAGAAGG
ncbi:MAG: ATP-dependent DNA ligase [Verrucomicrobiia bacterium]